MTDLDALLATLREKADAVAKAQPAPAAEPEAEEVVKAEAAPAAEEEADVAAAEEEADVAKSEGFEVTDAEGRKLHAIDGFALLKSMQDAIDGLTARVEAFAAPAPDAEVAKSFAAAASHTETLAKSLAAAFDALSDARAAQDAAAEREAARDARLAEQAEVIKSLSATVQKIGAEGSGRRSAVTVQERASVVAKADPALTVGEVFSKAIELNRAGKLTGLDVSRITAHANSGRGIPAEYAPLFAA